MDIAAPVTQADLQVLDAKIDRLTALMEAQERRAQAMDELKSDMVPIVNHMIKLSIDELAEIGTEFQLEDLFFLLKRLLRDTPLLVETLDKLEALHDLADETQLMGRQVFNQAVARLEEMEQAGYFAFGRGGMYVMERIVAEFGEEDVRALGDNIVTILSTVRNMTQPEVLTMANNLVGAVSEEPVPENVSVWRLLREFSDPQVRKGMARLLNIVKTLAE